MKVVSNTSLLCYLAWIEKLDLLVALFGEIIIPPAVLDELKAIETPVQVRRSFEQVPAWLKVQIPKSTPDQTLGVLHLGERQAILLAEEIEADLILLDDRDARRIVADRGLRLTGLLGVLDEAANRHLLDITEAIERLCTTSFRVNPALLRSLLERHRKEGG
jgi:predicted nucleic acid-binding protein